MTARPQRLGGLLALSALGIAVIIAALALPVAAQMPTGIPGVLAGGVAPELVQEGFVFTEGPVGTADGGLYFSDIRVGKTYFLDPGGKISVARENTNGANGLALTRDGELLFAEGDGKRITKRNRDGTIAVLTEGPPGAPLLAPNDLIVDAKGGIYFTDPGPRPVVPGRPTYVYYLPAGAKTPILVDGAVPRPNGLTLTNDGKTLIVDDTLNPTVFAYDVQPDGSVKNKRTFLPVPKAAPTAWRSTATTAFTSRPSPAFRCSTLKANTSGLSRPAARPPMRLSADPTSRRFTSRRGRGFIG
jgi:gluconolactonase